MTRPRNGDAQRVLFVTPHFPEDPARAVSGAFKRQRMWLDAIQSAGAELEMLFFTPSDADVGPENAARVSRALAEHWGIHGTVTLCPIEPGSARGLMARYVGPALALSRHANFWPYRGRRQRAAVAGALSRAPDVVLFFKLQGATPRWTRPPRARVLLDLDDIEFIRYWREISQPPPRPLRPLRRLWVPALWWGERLAIARSDRAFVCSEGDREQLRRLMGVRHVGVVPNAVARVADQPPSAEPNVMFIGTYGYPPNRLAAEYLVREVWPHLSRLCPDARLLIAGPRQELIPSHRSPPAGVEFLGFVDDLDALYRRTRVFCCPVQSGGGTRVKILEAASHGVPVVSTRVGAEGIDLVPEQEIVLREGAEALARACAELLADPARARRIGTMGRDRVRTLYSRDEAVARMRAELAVGAPATSAAG